MSKQALYVEDSSEYKEATKKYTEQLELRNKELAEEVVRLTNAYQDLSNRVDDDADKKIRAWAIDRALETMKHSGNGGDASTVTAYAECFVDWIETKGFNEGDSLPESHVKAVN